MSQIPILSSSFLGDGARYGQEEPDDEDDQKNEEQCHDKQGSRSPLGLKSFQATLSTQWGLYAAASILVSIPVVIVFLCLNRYLISGLTLGSVKE